MVDGHVAEEVYALDLKWKSIVDIKEARVFAPKYPDLVVRKEHPLESGGKLRNEAMCAVQASICRSVPV